MPQLREEKKEWVSLAAGFPGAPRVPGEVNLYLGKTEKSVIIDFGQDIRRELDIGELETGLRLVKRLLEGIE